MEYLSSSPQKCLYDCFISVLNGNITNNLENCCHCFNMTSLNKNVFGSSDLNILSYPIANILLFTLISYLIIDLIWSYFSHSEQLEQNDNNETREENRTILQLIKIHLMALIEPLYDFLSLKEINVFVLISRYINVLLYHFLVNYDTVSRFFSFIPSPPVSVPASVPVQKPTTTVTEEKITDNNVDQVLKIIDQNKKEEEEKSPSLSVQNKLEKWPYGNRAHRRRVNKLIKRIKNQNKALFAYGGDSHRNLNGCNNDLKHVISYGALNYSIPLNGIHVISQVNRKTDGMIEFCNDFQDLINEYRSSNEKFGSIKETSIQEVRKTMDKLVKQANSTKEEFLIVFHYSGHGANMVDRTDSDELDGKDEYILAGGNDIILDDEIYDRFISKLNSNVNLFFQMDQCFAGTSTDLPYKYNPIKKVFELINSNRKNIKCKCYSLSATNDKQYAYEVFFKTDHGKNEHAGPLTQVMVEEEIDGEPLYTYINEMVKVHDVAFNSLKSRLGQEPYLLSSSL